MKFTKVIVVVVLPLLMVAVGGAILHKSNARADGGIVVAQSDWPPMHEDLSRSAVDSTYADIEVLDGVVAVVWTEGASAIEVPGSIKMKWKFRGNDWHSTAGSDLPTGDANARYSYPALALQKLDDGSVKAHIVWLEQIGTNSRVGYATCTLQAATANCAIPEYPSANDARTRSAPDVAVDPYGNPHVVWAERESDTVGHIYYNNRVGGNWGNATGYPIRSDAALEDSPVMAITGNDEDGYKVYVAWDDNTNSASYAGIRAGERNSVGALGNTAANEQAMWTTRRLSTPGYADSPPEVDSWPAIAAEGNRVYVMWQRLVAKSTAGDPYCYQHALSYRVLTGTYFADDWWPGGSGMGWVSIFTSTTHVPAGLGGADDLYTGLRPSIQVVNKVLHVVWQHDTAGSCGGGGGQETLIRASGEGDLWPFVVDYGYADHTNIPPGEGTYSWTTMTLSSRSIADRFFTNPDLGIELIDGSPQIHVALQDRFPAGSAYAWDVWYLNDKEFYWVYLPLLLKSSH